MLFAKHNNILCVQVRTLVEAFKKRIPEVLTLGNLGLKRRHWEDISNIVGFVMFPDQNLTKAKVLNLSLGKFCTSI